MSWNSSTMIALKRGCTWRAGPRRPGGDRGRSSSRSSKSSAASRSLGRRTPPRTAPGPGAGAHVACREVDEAACSSRFPAALKSGPGRPRREADRSRRGLRVRGRARPAWRPRAGPRSDRWPYRVGAAAPGPRRAPRPPRRDRPPRAPAPARRTAASPWAPVSSSGAPRPRRWQAASGAPRRSCSRRQRRANASPRMTSAYASSSSRKRGSRPGRTGARGAAASRSHGSSRSTRRRAGCEVGPTARVTRTDAARSSPAALRV